MIFKVKRYCKRLIGSFNKMKLKNREFTIISNNCWGGFVYQKFNIKYNTPFIGLFIFSPDYINMLKNFENIIGNELIFIKSSQSRYKSELIKSNTFNKYPIAKLDKDVEIHFLHYKTELEAREKWEKRIKRINMNNLLVKFSDRDLCTDFLIEEFEKLPFKNKICFTAKEYKEFNCVIQLNEFEGKRCVESEWDYYEKYIDIVEKLNSL